LALCLAIVAISPSSVGSNTVDEDPCVTSPLAHKFADRMRQTVEDTCTMVQNVAARVITVQNDIRRIAGDQSDPRMPRANYKEKTEPNGLIDIAIGRSFVSDHSIVQVISNRKKSVVPISLDVGQYLERVADYSQNSGYQYVEIVFYQEGMKYYPPTPLGDGDYQIKVDSWQETKLCLTDESRTCHHDVTKKVFWVDLIKTPSGFDVKVDRITAESPYEYDAFNSQREIIFGRGY
jgi:hypothetical protein